MKIFLNENHEPTEELEELESQVNLSIVTWNLKPTNMVRTLLEEETIQSKRLSSMLSLL